MVRLIGIEPTHPAPEAGALSTELQARTEKQTLEKSSKISISHFRKKASYFLKIILIKKSKIKSTKRKPL